MAWSKTGNIKGPQGDSAYTVATKNGFVGTISQWLASLVGPAGASGNGWTQGSGAPASGAGIVGDSYLDVDTGDVYKKS